MKILKLNTLESKLLLIKDRLQLFFFDEGIIETEKLTLRKLYLKSLGTPEKLYTTTIITLMLLLATILLLLKMPLY